MAKPILFPITRELLKPLPFEKHDRLHVGLDKKGENFVLTVTTVGQTGYPSFAARSEWFSRIPERKADTAGIGFRFAAAATDCTVLVIHSLWPEEQVVFTGEAKLVYDYILLNVITQEQNLQLIARYREFHEVEDFVREFAVPTPPIETDVEDHPEHPLALYQRVGAHCSLNNPGHAEFFEQGTGKTPLAIAVCCNDAHRQKAKGLKRLYRCLVVTPKNTRMNWQNEFAKFSTRPGKVTVLRGGALNRTKQLLETMVPESNEQEYAAIICGYETLVKSWDLIKAIEWDLIITDEAHYYKSPYTNRFKYMMELRELGNRRLILTGTPVCNTPLDLFPQLEFVGKGSSGFASWKNFRSFYGVFEDRDAEGGKRLVGVQNMPFMKERLARVSMIVRKDEVLKSLPDKVYDVIEVEMTNEQQEIYTNLRDKLMIEIEDEINKADNKTLVVSNILTKLLRLAQITSGFVVWDPIFDEETGEPLREKSITGFEPNAKLEELIAVLKEKGPNDKTIVWACWRYDLHTISARLTKEGIDHVLFYGGTNDKDRLEAERRFNFDPKCKVFLGNQAAGGTGLNLLGYPPGNGKEYTTNANHVIYYSQDWSAVKRSQSEDRAHRRGTREPVRITDLCVPNTIDEEIRARVTNKRATALQISDVREILARCIGRTVST